jgi:hypothetical protein
MASTAFSFCSITGFDNPPRTRAASTRMPDSRLLRRQEMVKDVVVRKMTLTAAATAHGVMPKKPRAAPRVVVVLDVPPR